MKRNFIYFGGHPVLDFCNTIFIHGDSVEDLFESKQDIAKWCNDLSLKGKFDSIELDISLEAAQQIRTLLRNLFESVILNKNPSAPLKKLNVIFHNHPMSVHLHYSKELTTHLIAGQFSNQGIAWLQMQLQDFITNYALKRLKKCANSNCSHLFHDSSKSSTRVWCSMKSCGNIIKARNFRKSLKDY